VIFHKKKKVNQHTYQQTTFYALFPSVEQKNKIFEECYDFFLYNESQLQNNTGCHSAGTWKTTYFLQWFGMTWVNYLQRFMWEDHLC